MIINELIRCVNEFTNYYFILHLDLFALIRYNDGIILKEGGVKQMARTELTSFEKDIRSRIATNLKYLTNGMTQAQISDKTGIPASTLSGYFAERSTINPGNLQKLADFLGVSKGMIDPRFSDSAEDIISKAFKKPRVERSNSIPLLGTIAAGVPILAEENIEDYFNLDKKIKADFCLRIKGDSMINVNILDGDIVFLKKQEDLEDGQIGAVLVDDSATLKRFYRENGSVILQAENPAYKPIVISKGDVIILGKMVASLRQYK